jgi:hypothetical protein
MFTSIFVYGSVSGTLELQIRILADADPQHWSSAQEVTEPQIKEVSGLL